MYLQSMPHLHPPNYPRKPTFDGSSTRDNMTFLTNRGGVSGCSGVWSICGGNSQSFADASVRP